MKAATTFSLLMGLMLCAPLYAGTGARHDTNLISLFVLALLLGTLGIGALVRFIKARRRENHAVDNASNSDF